MNGQRLVLILACGLMAVGGCHRTQTTKPQGGTAASASGRPESSSVQSKESGLRVRKPSEAWVAWISRESDRTILGPDGKVLPPIEAFFFDHPETLCEPDDRTIVANPADAPWSANCRLIITMSDGQKAVGTGWLMGPKLVVTAGHCVHEGKDGKFFKQVEVIPAANSATKPFGSQVSTTLRASDSWKASGLEAGDYGAIILSKDFNTDGKLPANHATEVKNDATLKTGEILISGYPGDKPGTQWKDTDPVSSLTAERLQYMADTMPGQSGSAVLHVDRAVGIHNYGGCPNKSTRITKSVEDQLKKWLGES